jgi:hypothetical protein
VTGKIEAGIRERARRARDDLILRGTHPRVADTSVEEAGDALVEAWHIKPRTFRSERIFQAAFRGMRRRLREAPAASPAKKLVDVSTLYDVIRASVGAAYCDVFTCDRGTCTILGDTRERIGLSKALALGGSCSAEHFVRALTSSVPLR